MFYACATSVGIQRPATIPCHAPPHRPPVQAGDAHRDADIALLGQQVKALMACLDELRLAFTTALTDTQPSANPEHAQDGNGCHRHHPLDLSDNNDSDMESNINLFVPEASLTCRGRVNTCG